MVREFSKRNLQIVSYFEWGNGQCFISRKAFFKKISDFKGVKIRVPPGSGCIPMLAALGASPVGIPGGEVYSAMERGVADAVATGIDMGVHGWKLYEVARYLSFTGKYPPGGSKFIIINKSKFDAMPKEVQKVILEAGYDAVHKFYIGYLETRNRELLDMFEKRTSVAPFIVPQDEVKKWIDFTKEASIKWYLGTGGIASEVISIYEKFTGKKMR